MRYLGVLSIRVIDRFLNGLTDLTICMLTSPRIRKCAPVAQRIEHLPCWSLNGEGRFEKNSLSGRPHMRERPESLRYSSIELRVTIREDWVIRRKPPLNKMKGGFLRDYTGRDCDVQDIVQPANPRIPRAVRESLMLDAKQRAAGSSPAGGNQ